MKKILIIFSIILIILISGCKNNDYVEIDGEKITVEIAKTPKERQEGLMFRDGLCDNCGMPFIFEEEDFHSFWMKNTLIPLDMIFINSDLEVVDVLHAAPCAEDPCKTYTPKEKALYVLETNNGKFDEKIIGKKIDIS